MSEVSGDDVGAAREHIRCPLRALLHIHVESQPHELLHEMYHLLVVERIIDRPRRDLPYVLYAGELLHRGIHKRSHRPEMPHYGPG